MTPRFAASADDVLERLVLQIWPYRARGGDHAGARAAAERALERLLARGLPSRGAGAARLLDPYLASNALKARAREPADEAWAEWLQTARRNATSLPDAPHRYRLKLRREWRLAPSTGDRALVLRLPLPLREAQIGNAEIALLEPVGALIERRDGPGRVELRLERARVQGVVVAELTVEFVAGETREIAGPVDSAALAAEDQIWLKPNEGMIAPSAAIDAFARALPASNASALPASRASEREIADAAFDSVMRVLRLGDVHREQLDAADPLGGLLRSEWSDCALASSLLVAVCRARGIPARVVSGFLLHPVAPAPHSWAEVRVAPGVWVPYDLATWDYCAGDPADPAWGSWFRGRADARFVAEVAPREFTGWGSARPPERWLRLQRLRGDRVEHSLHALETGELVQRDQLALEILGPAPA